MYFHTSPELLNVEKEATKTECIVRTLPLAVLSALSYAACATELGDSNAMSMTSCISTNLPDASF